MSKESNKSEETSGEALEQKLEELQLQLLAKKDEMVQREEEVAKVYEDKLDELRLQLQAKEDELINQEADSVEPADFIALQWLENNCSKYTINRSGDQVKISGELQTLQTGYTTRFVPRIFRKNGRPPYAIHEEDTFQHGRTCSFSYQARGESLAQSVEAIIVLYCPGETEIAAQVFEENKEADYGNGHKIWVQPSYIDLEEFQKLPEVGCTDGYDLSIGGVARHPVPGR